MIRPDRRIDFDDQAGEEAAARRWMLRVVP
jgi:hypothetical protein